jgi:hypothetical protein
MNRVATACLIVAGLINFVPVVGVLSAQVLAGFYEIPPPQGDLLILMRHRALFFGILGSLILVSAFRRHLQPAAIAAGLISMLGFVALAVLAGDYGAKVHGAIVLDLVGSAGLVFVLLLRRRESR